jgi:hypothetical protein
MITAEKIKENYIATRVRIQTVRVGFIARKLALSQSFIEVLWVSSISFIQPMLHINSFILPSLYNLKT